MQVVGVQASHSSGEGASHVSQYLFGFACTSTTCRAHLVIPKLLKRWQVRICLDSSTLSLHHVLFLSFFVSPQTVCPH